MKNNCMHLYFYPFEKQDFTNLAAGIIGRGLGHSLKVAYVNESDKWLSNYFNKFQLKNFNTIDEFNSSQDNFDMVIFDDISINTDQLYKYHEMETVVITSSSPLYDNLKKTFSFNLISNFEVKENNNNNQLTIITGDGKGKSSFCFGAYIRECIKKKIPTSLIYFDKGGDFYGEKFLFENFSSHNCNYFEYGKERFDGKNFRFENSREDFVEAENAFYKLKEEISKKEFVIAEELNTTIAINLLSENILEDLLNSGTKILASGRYAPQNFETSASTIIKVNEEKHYVKEGIPVRKGIDY